MPDGQALMSAEEFAAKVKAKYPGAYDHLQPQELAAKVLQKFPEYSSRVMSPGVSESRKASAATVRPETMMEGAAPLGYTDPAAQRAFQSGVHTRTKVGAEMVGGAVGGEAVAGLKGIASLPRLIQALGVGSGAGAGAGAGALATGSPPKQALATAAGTTAGTTATMALSPFVKWLTSSKTVGAKMLQHASERAGSAPIELSPRTNELVEKIVEQGKLGGRIPKVITDLLERVGPSARQSAEAVPGPLTYNEARILQGNASELSTEESLALKGRAKGLMKQFAQSFSQDVQKGVSSADAVAGKQHAAGMRQYALASSRGRVGKAALKATPYIGSAVAGGATAYELLKRINR